MKYFTDDVLVLLLMTVTMLVAGFVIAWWNWRAGKKRQKLVDEVYGLIVESIGTEKDAFTWLKTENFRFRCKTPLQRMESMEGTQAVLDELVRLRQERR